MAEPSDLSMQALVSAAVRHVSADLNLPEHMFSIRAGMYVHDSWVGNMRKAERQLLGPQAPKRKRRKRLAKKLARRGGYLRTRGIMQSMLRAWPAMGFWWEKVGAR